MTYIYTNKATRIFVILLHTCTLLLLNSCKKLIEVNTPKTSIDAKNVYTNNLTATAVLTGIYSKLSSSNLPSTEITSIGLITGLSSDELTLYSGSADFRLKSYYQNNLRNISNNQDFWTTIYSEINIINLSIEELTTTKSLTPVVKKQLIGEAKFSRAIFYFYMINMYGDVPLVLNTDYTVNNSLARTSMEKVWDQIISDLEDAKVLLSSEFLDGTLITQTTERVRPTKWAATALLARCYLYIKDWKNAETQSTEIIKATDLFYLESLDKVFLMNNHEAIWQLQPVNLGSNTEDAKLYTIPSTGPSNSTPVYISTHLLNSFDTGDRRKKIWIDTVTSKGILYYFPHKYKAGTLNEPLTEYNTIFRLGEQYLIRAEAKAQQNNLNGAKEDLNSIRLRAGLKESTINDKSSLINAIYHERQVELFTEWGHRWFDLKRTQNVDAVMNIVTPLKGGVWNTNWQLYPIPPYDIITDGNLTQNNGY